MSSVRPSDLAALLTRDGCMLLVLLHADQKQRSALIGLIAALRATDAGRNVHILLTSLEPLGIDGEHPFPLALGDSTPIAEEVLAGRLRRQDLDEARERGLLDDIRTMVGNNPLAVELAFGLAGVESLFTIRESLRDLTPADTNDSDRLQATLRWAFYRRSLWEQRVLRRMAPFGSLSHEAATAVCAGANLPQDAVPAILVSLVRTNWLSSRPAYRRPDFREGTFRIK